MALREPRRKADYDLALSSVLKKGSHVLELLKAAGDHPIVRAFPVGALFVFDHELRYICAGGPLLASMGHTRDDVEGKTIYEVFSTEMAKRLEGPYRRTLAGEEIALDLELQGRILLHRMAPLRDEDGAIVAGIGFTADVTDSRSTERSLSIERRRLRDAEFIGRAGSWEWDLITGVITWSDGLFALHGLEPRDFPGGYPEAASRVHPDDRAAVDKAMEKAKRNEPVQFRYRVSRAVDEETRWFDSRASGVLDENGQLTRLVGSVADVTDTVTAQENVLETNAFLNAVLAASPDYTFVLDLRTGKMVFGSNDRDLLGRSSDEIHALGPKFIVHPDDQAALEELNAKATKLEDGQLLRLRYRLQHASGEWHWMSRVVVPFRRDSSGNVTQVLGVLRDVTDIVRAEEQLRHEALHDELTGLPNRSLLLDRLEAALMRSVRDGREIAVLFCDLDGFKMVNDTAGHSAGDAVLRGVAHRLLGAVRDGDTVARVGGDEFVVIVEPWNRPGTEHTSPEKQSTGNEIGIDVADRIIRMINVPFHTSDGAHEITVSIGVAYPMLDIPHGSLSEAARRAVEEADAAMYLAKRDGKNRIRVSDQAK